MPENLKESNEKIAARFGFVEVSNDLTIKSSNMRKVLTSTANRQSRGGTMSSVSVIKGFEDLLGREIFGEGLYYNTALAAFRLPDIIFCANPDFDYPPNISQAELVKMLRKQKPLENKIILDLGSGEPALAKVLQSIGAEVYTADYNFPVGGDKHMTDIDFNDADAPARLLEQFGQVDVCHESIIGTVDNNRDLKRPRFEKIAKIAVVVVKPGGYLISKEGEGLFHKSA